MKTSFNGTSMGRESGMSVLAEVTREDSAIEEAAWLNTIAKHCLEIHVKQIVIMDLEISSTAYHVTLMRSLVLSARKSRNTRILPGVNLSCE